MRYTNKHNIPWSVALWLATDTYDHDRSSNVISATSLMKSTKQNILSKRVENHEIDISTRAASRIGTAVHESIEEAWTRDSTRGLKTLGVPEKVADNIIINPTERELAEYERQNLTPQAVYMELRSYKNVGDYRVSGKFDFVMDGRLEDFKTTKTYSYIKKTKDKDYQMQGSIYRWLNPTIIYQEHMTIQFIFTDWSQGLSNADPKYPQQQCLPYPIPLLSLEETQAYVENKVHLIATHKESPEEDMPRCTEEELWQDKPKWKYYKNPAKTDGRSTKNFDNPAEANERLINDGSVGVVKRVEGQVVACRYCDAFSICKQKDEYLNNGTLIV